MTPHQQLVDHLTEGALDAEDRAHATHCPACAVLLLEGGQDVLSPEVRTAWLNAAHQELTQPVRPWWLPALGLALGNAVLAVSATAVLVPTNWATSTSPRWLFLTAFAVLAALAIGGVFLVLAPRRRWLDVALGLAVLAPVTLLVAADGRVAGQHFLNGMGCLGMVLALALLPLAGSAWLLSQVAYSPTRALAGGLVSAGVGLLVLQFTCDDGSGPHLLVFHVLPWAVLGVAAILVRRALATRSFAP